ncbi:unnamed protein product, partial [Polarella glacialis]
VAPKTRSEAMRQRIYEDLSDDGSNASLASDFESDAEFEDQPMRSGSHIFERRIAKTEGDLPGLPLVLRPSSAAGSHQPASCSFLPPLLQGSIGAIPALTVVQIGDDMELAPARSPESSMSTSAFSATPRLLVSAAPPQSRPNSRQRGPASPSEASETLQTFDSPTYQHMHNMELSGDSSVTMRVSSNVGTTSIWGARHMKKERRGR